MLGLYIHIPFCDRICSYCDFLKLVSRKPLIEQYVDALIKEINLKKDTIKDINTIYIGGGTPSSIDISLLEKIIFYLSTIIDLNLLEEFTIEANPKDIDQNFINLLKKYNINRISLGVQTFNNKKLKLLNRNHTCQSAKKALQLLNDNDFPNVSIDLIYGFPNDSFSLIKNDINIAKEYNVKHISCYSLILEDKTLLKYKYDNNEFSLMDEDKEAKLYYKISNYLNSLGYNHYEISNYAKEGYQSIHNKIYWNNQEYIALGIGASSYFNSYRFKNIRNINKYIQLLNNKCSIEELKEENELLDLNQKIEEEIMLKLRLMEGINKLEFLKKYNVDIKTQFPHINQLLKDNLLIENENNIFINPSKLYISDSIILFIYN